MEVKREFPNELKTPVYKVMDGDKLVLTTSYTMLKNIDDAPQFVASFESKQWVLVPNAHPRDVFAYMINLLSKKAPQMPMEGKEYCINKTLEMYYEDRYQKAFSFIGGYKLPFFI